MDIIIRDPTDLSLVATVPAHAETGWLEATVTERLWRPDEVELHLPAQLARDIGVRKRQLAIIDGLVMLIEQVRVSADERSRVASLATVTGYEASSVPRRTLPPSAQSHDVQSDQPGETALKHYMDANLGPSASATRRWPPLMIEADQGRGTSGTWRARYQLVTDWLEVIGQQTGVGYQTRWIADAPTFVCVVGEHRDRLFAIGEGTAADEDLLTTDVDRETYVYVAGQGEGADRTIVERHTGPEPEGLERREGFIDARDTDDPDTLTSRGDARLAETATGDAAELEVAESDHFTYRTHFALGDTIEWSSDFADQRTVRFVEVVSRYDVSLVAPTRNVVLDRPWPGEHRPDSGGAPFI